MKRLLSLVLSALLAVGLSACSSGVSQEEYDKIITERDELQAQLDLVNENSDDLLIFKTAGYVFSFETTCVEIGDGVVQVTIPYEIENTADIDDFSEKGTLLFQGIAVAMTQTDYTSCIVIFVDDGECYIGMNCKRDGGTSTFALEDMD